MDQTHIYDQLSLRFDADNPFPLREHLISLSIVGSRGYNLHTEDSDYDLIGVVAPPVEYVYGLHPWDKGWHPKKGSLGEELDVKIYPITKYVRLLLKANPNILESLWIRPEERIITSAPMEKLIAERKIFSSKTAWKAFRGTIHGMRKRLDGKTSTRHLGGKRKAWIEELGLNPKDGFRMAHMIVMAQEFMATGKLPVYLPKGSALRKALLGIKEGSWSLDAVLQFVDEQEKIAETVYENSPLPEHPNVGRAEELLLSICESSWN